MVLLGNCMPLVRWYVGLFAGSGIFLKDGHTHHLSGFFVVVLFDVVLLVPESEDISLKERVSRINVHCETLGKSNVILISIHVNAAGNGSKWLNATGWSCYTCKGQTQSDKLAECLYESAAKYFQDRKIRTDYARDGDPDWEENFYILRKSWCPAVLTENFFMDNHSDLEYLQSRAGKQAVVDTHVEGIVEWLENLESY